MKRVRSGEKHWQRHPLLPPPWAFSPSPLSGKTHIAPPGSFSSPVLSTSRSPFLLLLLHICYFSRHPPSSSSLHASTNVNSSTTNATSTNVVIAATAPPPTSPIKEPFCDYSVGKWVPASLPPLYNGTSCSAIIKDRQNCMANGRPDTSYLQYRWVPSSSSCPEVLPRFHPAAFLSFLRHRRLAFVGDSVARNQLESLLCLLSSHSRPTLIFSDEKCRRWLFPSHNLTVSLFWSPFLVHGLEKSPPSLNHNTLDLHTPDPLWLPSSASADVLVLSAGHWFLHPAIYRNSSAGVAGCHGLDEESRNCTEVGFYGAFGNAYRTALAAVIAARKAASVGSTSPAMVVVTTFTPAHFEGEWNRLGTCSRTEPYGETEKEVVGWMDAEMRRRQVEELEAARAEAAGVGVKLEPLDVTRMAAMRPDGHPGPYMHAFPFRNGVKERLPNDCVHWCLPGPIDAWNEVLLQLVKRWRKEIRESRRAHS